jgi:hypothetical protein
MASAQLLPRSSRVSLPHANLVEAERWPAAPAQRWLLRLALAVPYLALAVAVAARDVTSGANQRLESAGAAISWGSSDIGEFLGQMYPPIPVAVASLLPSGASALAFVGALVAGSILHALWERLHVRETPAWLTLTLLVTFAATPAFAYLTAEDLTGFVGLGLFAAAVTGFLRFATVGDTEGGFLCGLALGVAVACDPVGLVYAVCLGAAAAPVAWSRYRGQTGATRASALVIVFPAIAALLSWTFLQWRFTGSALDWLRDLPGAFEFNDGVVGGLGEAARRVGIGLAVSPLFVVTQVLLVRRRAEAILVALLPIVGLIASLWLGLRTPAGHTIVLLGMLGVLSVPRRPSRPLAAILGVVAVAGWIAAVVQLESTSNVVHEWLRVMVG